MKRKRILFGVLLGMAVLCTCLYVKGQNDRSMTFPSEAVTIDGVVTDVYLGKNGISHTVSTDSIQPSKTASVSGATVSSESVSQISVSQGMVLNQEASFTEAANYSQLITQIQSAIETGNINFLKEKLRFKNGDNKYDSYDDSHLGKFVEYLTANTGEKEAFINTIAGGAVYSATVDGKYIVALPIVSFAITSDMENTTITLDNFEGAVIGTKDVFTRGPLLPMEYKVTAENSGWPEKQEKKVKVDLTNAQFSVAFTSGEQAVHTGGHVIAIDPGHQGKGDSSQEPIGPGAAETKPKVASGTSGAATGIKEYQLTLDVSLKLKQELISRGYEVVMIRETNDVNISNAARAEIANTSGADVFVRIHGNGASDSSINGALTMAPSAGNPYCGTIAASSQLLSKYIIDNLCAKTGAKNRGVSITDTMSGINWCRIPVSIIEMGFMSNPEEDQKMASADYQNLIVAGIADGIDAYYAN